MKNYYLKIPLKEKEILFQNIYTEEILQGADILLNYEKCAQVCARMLPVGCYTNFRDALFHFRKMHHSAEENEIRQQAFAVREHMKRARTDARMTVLLWYAKVAEVLLPRDDINETQKAKIRELIHQMKNIVIFNRMEGMMMSEAVFDSYSEDDVFRVMQDYLDFIQCECSEQFIEIREKMK